MRPLRSGLCQHVLNRNNVGRKRLPDCAPVNSVARVNGGAVIRCGVAQEVVACVEDRHGRPPFHRESSGPPPPPRHLVLRDGVGRGAAACEARPCRGIQSSRCTPGAGDDRGGPLMHRPAGSHSARCCRSRICRVRRGPSCPSCHARSQETSELRDTQQLAAVQANSVLSQMACLSSHAFEASSEPMTRMSGRVLR